MGCIVMFILKNTISGGEPIAAMISAYEFDNSPQDIALLRNISGVSAACHMPFIGAVGPKFFLKDNMEDVAAIKDTLAVSHFQQVLRRQQVALLAFEIRLNDGTHDHERQIHRQPSVPDFGAGEAFHGVG